MEIFKGQGVKSDEKHLIEVLDEVFFSEEDTRFMTLLPKLYKDKYNPGEHNLLIKEDGVIKAAVGCYPINVNAAGRELRIMGIGNVAVAKDCRRKGYMIELMNMALKKMIEEGYDYSLLGGQRQRYEHFGYGPAGSAINFTINKDNISRLRDGSTDTPFTAKLLEEDDAQTIAKIKALYDAMPFRAQRREEDMFNILNCWKCKPYVVSKDGEFKGYFVMNDATGYLAEVKVLNVEETLEFLLCIMETADNESVSFTVPVYDTAFCDFMAKRCCGMALCHVEQLNILNYARFVEAFLAIKAQRVNLCSGTLNVLVHGYAGDEKIAITVDGKEVTVTATDAQPDVELDHLEAVAFFAGNYSMRRLSLPAFAQNWFPVDFFMFGQDNV
ncbi:MAG: GNAT family N-acetyltransferase [Clostridia bacterium]|nr:GNAT family N-acetyltransferase [Clostridia bacterium]